MDETLQQFAALEQPCYPQRLNGDNVALKARLSVAHLHGKRALL